MLTKPIKIYVVTEGDYSDRTNIAAFTLKKDAENAVISRLGNLYHEILLNPKVPVAPTGKKLFNVFSNGEIFEDSYWYEVDEGISIKSEEVSKEESFSHVRCWAKDEEDALKIAKENLNA